MDPATEAILSGQPVPVAAPVAAATPAPVAEPISNAPATDAGKQIAPVVSQAGETAQPVVPAVPAPAKSEQASPVISDEQLLNAAGLTESPEKKLGRLERDHSASSKEARRLLEYSKSIEDILKEQGADIAKDETGKPIGLIANKKYSKDAAGLDIKVKDLPENIQAEFESDPQKVVDFIVDKAKKSLTRIAPTLEKTVLPLSPERHEAAVNYLADMKWETGDTKFPGLAANRKLIEQMVNAPSASKALKEFYNQEPETALALLNLQLDHARSHIAEQARKAAEIIEAKKNTAESQPQPIPSGGGAPTFGSGDDLESQTTGGRLQKY
jgi:hypothetical protein